MNVDFFATRNSTWQYDNQRCGFVRRKDGRVDPEPYEQPCQFPIKRGRKAGEVCGAKPAKCSSTRSFCKKHVDRHEPRKSDTEYEFCACTGCGWGASQRRTFANGHCRKCRCKDCVCECFLDAFPDRVQSNPVRKTVCSACAPDAGCKTCSNPSLLAEVVCRQAPLTEYERLQCATFQRLWCYRNKQFFRQVFQTWKDDHDESAWFGMNPGEWQTVRLYEARSVGSTEVRQRFSYMAGAEGEHPIAPDPLPHSFLTSYACCELLGLRYDSMPYNMI